MIKSCDIARFLDKFKSNYKWLYSGADSMSGYYELVETFDTLLQANESFKLFVGCFVDYREDIISSDREAAAFVITMYDFNLL